MTQNAVGAATRLTLEFFTSSAVFPSEERAFRIRVRACNSKGSSEWSREQLARTRQAPALCGGTVRAAQAAVAAHPVAPASARLTPTPALGTLNPFRDPGTRGTRHPKRWM